MDTPDKLKLIATQSMSFYLKSTCVGFINTMSVSVLKITVTVTLISALTSSIIIHNAVTHPGVILWGLFQFRNKIRFSTIYFLFLKNFVRSCL